MYFRLPARGYVILFALSIGPLLPSCVCVAPKFPDTPCFSDSECSLNGTIRCVNGKCETCAPNDPNCGAQTCIPGETRGCTIPGALGPCRLGLQSCLSTGTGFSSCVSNSSSQDEICNGRDDDCDGQVDETFTEKFSVCVVENQLGPCRRGEFTACQNGVKVCTPNTFPSTEGPGASNCQDGIDNDCDGAIDDPVEDGCLNNKCTTGATQQCFPSTESGCTQTSADPPQFSCRGTCRTGTRVCGSSGTWGPCTGAVAATAEVCKNQLDDNCNGQVDDNCDNKCTVGSTRPCYTGGAGCTKEADGTYTCVGICQSGQQVCQANQQWGSCENEVLPQKEFCPDKKDNDCNGQVDDCQTTGDCKAGETRACYNGNAGCKQAANGSYTCVGACKAGTQTCTAALTWSACQGAALPSKEICPDSIDNDCNGAVDDCQVSELVSGSWDINNPLIVWNLQTSAVSKQLTNSKQQPPIYAARFDPTGKLLATASDNNYVTVWNPDAGTVVWEKADHTASVFALAIDATGKTLASCSADKTVRFWALANGQSQGQISGLAGIPYAVALDAGATQAAVATGTITLYDVATKKSVATLSGHTGDIFALAYHPTAKFLVSGGKDGKVILWDLTTNKSAGVFTKHTKSITALDFNPKGTGLVVGSADGTLSFWSFASGKLTFVSQVTPTGAGPIYSVSYHPTKAEAACGTYNKNVYIVDVATGKVTKTLTGHNDVVSAVTYRP